LEGKIKVPSARYKLIKREILKTPYRAPEEKGPGLENCFKIGFFKLRHFSI